MGEFYSRPAPLETRMLVEDFRFEANTAAQYIGEAAELFGVPVDVEDVDFSEDWPHRPTFFEDVDRLQSVVGGDNEVGVPATAHLAEIEELITAGLPAGIVAKREGSSFGLNKHLLDTDKRFGIFMDWLEAHPEESEHWLFQQHIESPVDRPVSIRVFVDCLGNVIGSQLQYGITYDHPRSELQELQRDMLKGRLDPDDPQWELLKKSGPFYLSPKPVASNVVLLRQEHRYDDFRSVWRSSDTLIGGKVMLDAQPNSHPTSHLEHKILRDLGLEDEDDGVPRLPLSLARNAAEIAEILTRDDQGRIVALYLGIDYAIDQERDHFFLEANRRPSLMTIRDLFGGADKVNEHTAFDWLIEDIVRRIALRGGNERVVVAETDS